MKTASEYAKEMAADVAPKLSRKGFINTPKEKWAPKVIDIMKKDVATIIQP